MKSQLDNLLNQKMDRKQFLKNIGAGLTAVVGVGVIVKALQPQSTQQGTSASYGYGASAYGGPQASATPLSTPKA